MHYSCITMYDDSSINHIDFQTFNNEIRFLIQVTIIVVYVTCQRRLTIIEDTRRKKSKCIESYE